jgi:hypothetical protein
VLDGRTPPVRQPPDTGASGAAARAGGAPA